MEFLKTVTRKDPFWKELVAQCSASLAGFEPSTENSIDADYEILKGKLLEAVTNALKQAKPFTTYFKPDSETPQRY